MRKKVSLWDKWLKHVLLSLLLIAGLFTSLAFSQTNQGKGSWEEVEERVKNLPKEEHLQRCLNLTKEALKLYLTKDPASFTKEEKDLIRRFDLALKREPTTQEKISSAVGDVLVAPFLLISKLAFERKFAVNTNSTVPHSIPEENFYYCQTVLSPHYKIRTVKSISSGLEKSKGKFTFVILDLHSPIAFFLKEIYGDSAETYEIKDNPYQFFNEKTLKKEIKKALERENKNFCLIFLDGYVYGDFKDEKYNYRIICPSFNLEKKFYEFITLRDQEVDQRSPNAIRELLEWIEKEFGERGRGLIKRVREISKN